MSDKQLDELIPKLQFQFRIGIVPTSGLHQLLETHGFIANCKIAIRCICCFPGAGHYNGPIVYEKVVLNIGTRPLGSVRSPDARLSAEARERCTVFCRFFCSFQVFSHL
jgi:hypothetical protein